jgi:hypothetical protein
LRGQGEAPAGFVLVLTHRVGQPFPAVEAGEHRATEIEHRLRRAVAGVVKAQTKGDAVVQRQFGDVAHLHLARQARAACHGVVGHAPQRCHAREEHEQGHHDRRAQQRHGGCGAQRLHQGRAPHGLVRVDQRRQQAQQAQQHGCSRGERLRIEEVAEHGEEREKEDHHRVALGACLQCLECQQQDDEGEPRITPDDGAVRQQRACHGAQHQQVHGPAPWQGLGAPGQRAAQQQQQGHRHRGPDRQLAHQRRNHPGDHAQHEQGVSGITWQGGQGLAQVHALPLIL